MGCGMAAKRYETATWGDGVLSVVMPFWGVVIGMLAIIVRKERRRGAIMIGIGVIVLAVWALMVIGSQPVQAKGHQPPKVPTYQQPKLGTPPAMPVGGYIKRDGTYVPPHMRTAPNATKTDNWSSRPNVNPYTGRRGTKNPYAPPSSGG